MIKSKQQAAIAAGVALLGLLLLLLLIQVVRRGVAPEEIAQRIVATIQSEARASLLVTGSLDLTATVTIENAKRLLPGLLNLDLGTSRAMVQVPGRAYYGFDVRELDKDRITVSGDTIRITVPTPRLLSVDANLQQMQIWSDKGWLRSAASVQAVERAAIVQIDNALARQAAEHVANSIQPRVNSAEAIRRAIEPVLAAAGIAKPVFRFQLSERMILE